MAGLAALAALAPGPSRALSGAAAADCPTCGEPRPERYCPACGERRVEPEEFGFGHFFRQVAGGLTNFDGRFWGSLLRLLLRPGELTADWIRGARGAHLRPFQLFLLVNVVVALTAIALHLDSWLVSDGALDTSWNQRAMAEQTLRLGLTPAEYETLYAKQTAHLGRSTVMLTIPLVALISLLLHVRGERRAGVHLVFACHAVAFFLLVPDFLFSLVSPRPLQFLTTLDGGKYSLLANALRGVVPLLLSTWWWYGAQRRAFGNTRWGALWRGLLGAAAFMLLGSVAHKMTVFAMTLWLLER